MSWRRVEKPREIKGIDAATGKIIAVLDLQVATAADLPELGSEVENYIVAAGSMAQIVEADAPTFVTLSGDSENWHPSQSGEDEGGGGEPETLNLSPLSLGKSESSLKPSPDVYEEQTEEPEQDGDDDERELL